MKKSFISHCAKILTVAMIGVCLMSCDDSAKVNKLLEKANAAINEGDYTAAYAIVDEMISEGNGYDETANELNKRILTNEIAATIDSTEGANAAMKLILIIKERVQYSEYYPWRIVEEECKMLELAIQLTRAKGDEVCAKQLQSVLDELKESVKKDSEEEDEDEDWYDED